MNEKEDERALNAQESGLPETVRAAEEEPEDLLVRRLREGGVAVWV